MANIKIIPIGSGSSGNSFYINIDNHQLIIDFGLSYKKIKETLLSNNININDIEYGFITHKHNDHINGLKVCLKNFDMPYYTINSCANYLNKKYETSVFKPLKNNDQIMLDDLVIKTIRLSHDVECTAYIFETSNSKVVYATDTGCINQKALEAFKGADVVIVEANHDIDMLENGTYPRMLKDRIESDFGHLSNKDCAIAIKYLNENGTNNFLLAHLSKENNTEELALKEVNSILTKKANLYVCPIYGNDLLFY